MAEAIPPRPAPIPSGGAVAHPSGAAPSLGGPAAGTAVTEAHPVELPSFGRADFTGTDETPTGLALLDDVALKVKIELGRTRMYVEDVLKLNENSVVELDKAAGDPVDIYVNDRHVARGEVLVLNENFCVRISEIIQQVAPQEHA